MKRFIAVLLLIVIAVIAAPFLVQTERSMPPLQNLPWQIQVNADGSSTVFGFTLDRSTLGDAQARFGPEMELAIIAAAGETGALEAYISRFTAGVLTGKLILNASLAPEQLRAMRLRAARARPTPSGGMQFVLGDSDLATVAQATITAITFVPSVDIDRETAVQRFGEPARQIEDQNGGLHLLYPDRGLDLLLNPEQKEVLQYVAPARFDRVLEPLRTQAERANP